MAYDPLAISSAEARRVKPGATWRLCHFMYQDEDQAFPVDLTGCSARMAFAPKQSDGSYGTAVLELDSAEGSLIIEADKEGTDTWTNIEALPAPASGEVWILSVADAGAPARADGTAAQAYDGLMWDGVSAWVNIGQAKGRIRTTRQLRILG